MSGFNNRIEMVEVKSANLETVQWNSPNLKNCESLDFKKKEEKERGPQGLLEKQQNSQYFIVRVPEGKGRKV